MKIYTKGGDKGNTSLVGGQRVPKNHPRVEAYGNADELISYLGIIRSEAGNEELESVIRRIQQNLMLGSAHLACEGESSKLKSFDESEISFLESEIDKMTDQMPQQTAFVLPAGPRIASECHVARTICRRTERACIPLLDEGGEIPKVVRYMNRLSDYLFTLARYMCYVKNVKEDFWLP